MRYVSTEYSPAFPRIQSEGSTIGPRTALKIFENDTAPRNTVDRRIGVFVEDRRYLWCEIHPLLVPSGVKTRHFRSNSFFCRELALLSRGSGRALVRTEGIVKKGRISKTTPNDQRFAEKIIVLSFDFPLTSSENIAATQSTTSDSQCDRKGGTGRESGGVGRGCIDVGMEQATNRLLRKMPTRNCNQLQTSTSGGSKRKRKPESGSVSPVAESFHRVCSRAPFEASEENYEHQGKSIESSTSSFLRFGGVP